MSSYSGSGGQPAGSRGTGRGGSYNTTPSGSSSKKPQGPNQWTEDESDPENDAYSPSKRQSCGPGSGHATSGHGDRLKSSGGGGGSATSAGTGTGQSLAQGSGQTGTTGWGSLAAYQQSLLAKMQAKRKTLQEKKQ